VRKVTLTRPDMTGLAAIYTINDSYLLGAFRSGTWLKARSKYRIVGGYGNINLSFYSTVGGVERKHDFNFKTVPLSGRLEKQFVGTGWSAGLRYLYLQSTLSAVGQSLPEFVTDLEVDSRVSLPALGVNYDTRDNIFTPDRGYLIDGSFSWSDPIFGSDYSYENISAFAFGYFPVHERLIAGFRAEYQQVFGTPPFYLKPFINLRGIPVARYQGNIFSVAETEFRWDVVRRWSAVAFVGSGKAYDQWSEFVARQFKLRMGVDIARSPGQWAYYLVFGSAWIR
jgi:outer membrane protein assembly factor BamA